MKDKRLIYIKEKALEKEGKCLSDIYINNRSLLKFQCKYNHIWETCWKNINKGAWCPKCSLKSGKNHSRFGNLDEFKKIASDRGGLCLSLDYLGAHSKLKWQCNLGHQWEAKPNNIKSGHWCPDCSSYIGEKVCKLIFETIFNEEFIKIRPHWLLNSTSNRSLELDGYCKKLNIAFEYNGEQHYSDNAYFNKSKYDDIKLTLCNKNKTKLFIIKSIDNINNYSKIIEQIKIQAINFEMNINTDIKVDFNKVYINNDSILLFNKIKQIVNDKNGKCLSNKYISSTFKLQFKCSCNHEWRASPNSIINGKWCPNCANKIKSINDAIILAKSKNGECLSDNYINSNSKLKWQCSLNHKWEASYNQIQSGNWCPDCFSNNRGKSKRLKIDVYKNAAKNKGGECLSDIINSCYDKLQWKCNRNHIWFSRADAIKNTKQWCPQCALLNRRKI